MSAAAQHPDPASVSVLITHEKVLESWLLYSLLDEAQLNGVENHSPNGNGRWRAEEDGAITPIFPIEPGGELVPSLTVGRNF